MEQQSNNFDDFTRKLIIESGMHKPTPDFSKRVVEAIELKSVKSNVYQPLISQRSWVFIIITVVVCLISLYFLPITGNSILDKLEIGQYINLEFSLPEIKLSKTFIYAIGFLSLFLVQIPILKYYELHRFDKLDER